MRLIAVLVGALACATAPAGAASKKVAGGATQVVAAIDGREITLSELRSEMARLGLAPTAPEAEQFALQSLINRALLAKAARKADVHRRPEALLRMRAAEEQALADVYLSLAAQALEPTRPEINAFIGDHPELFEKRRRYEFAVISLATASFDEETMTPLFDETKTFDALRESLDAEKIPYTFSMTVKPSSAFPLAIRRQLGVYGVGDNIILKGDPQSQILKIVSARAERLPRKDWPVLARQYLLEESGSSRARDVMERLRKEATVDIFRQSAAPKPAATGQKSAASSAKR